MDSLRIGINDIYFNFFRLERKQKLRYILWFKIVILVWLNMCHRLHVTGKPSVKEYVFFARKGV